MTHRPHHSPLLFALLAAVLLAGCRDYGDDLQQIGRRVEVLEGTDLLQLQQDVTDMQTLVSAAETQDYVTQVVQNADGSYTVSFGFHDPVTLRNGQDGQRGDDGTAGIIGVRQDPADGLYYWTIDGEWLLDGSGSKVRASGIDGEKGPQGAQGGKGPQGEPGQQGEVGEDGQPTTTVMPRLRIDPDTRHWQVWNETTQQWDDLGYSADGKDGVTDYVVSYEFDPINLTVTLITADGQRFVYSYIPVA